MMSKTTINYNEQKSKEVKMMDLSTICLSDNYRYRERDCAETVDRYAETIQQYIEDKAQAQLVQFPFPAIDVFFDGHKYFVAAGRHRFLAAKKVGLNEIPCILITDRSTAIHVGMKSNRHNALALKSGDIVHCVRIAIKEFPEWSFRMIGNLVGCTGMRVCQIAKKENLRPAELTTVISKNGTKQPIHKNRSNASSIAHSMVEPPDQRGKQNSAQATHSHFGGGQGNEGNLSIGKVHKTSKTRKPSEKHDMTNPFVRAIVEGEYTGKAFRTGVRQLSKSVDDCKITEGIVNYFEVCVTIKGIANIIASLKSLPKLVPTRELEKQLALLQKKKQELQTQIVKVLIFGQTIYKKSFDGLQKNACNDEEKNLLAGVEKQFTELWTQVQKTMESAKVATYKVLKTESDTVVVQGFADELERVVEQGLSDIHEEADSFSEVAVTGNDDDDVF